MPETPFDNVESAQRYVALLIEAVEEGRKEVQEDIGSADATEGGRQLEALRLVDHKLHQLSVHLRGAKRTLNDLRMLRRVLLGQEEER